MLKVISVLETISTEELDKLSKDKLADVDVEAVEMFREKLEKQFGHLNCMYHPKHVCKIVAIVENNREAIDAIDFCCEEFEDRVKESYLKNYPHKSQQTRR